MQRVASPAPDVFATDASRDTHTESRSDSVKSGVNGSGFCRVRRTENGLQLGFPRAKGWLPWPKRAAQVDWVDFSSPAEATSHPYMQNIARTLHKGLRTAQGTQRLAKGLGRAACLILPRLKNRAIGGVLAGQPTLQQPSAVQWLADLFVQTGLQPETDLCAIAPAAAQFSLQQQLAVAYYSIATAVGAYFGDDRLRTMLPALGTLIGRAPALEATELAILVGCASGAVAAQAMQHLLPMGEDVVVYTQFSATARATRTMERRRYGLRVATVGEDRSPRDQQHISHREDGPAELYVQIVCSTTGTTLHQVPLAYGTRDVTTSLEPRNVSNTSGVTCKAWGDMREALQTTRFQRQDRAVFKQVPLANG